MNKSLSGQTRIAAVIVAVIALALAYGANDYFLVSILVLACGGLWLLSSSQHWKHWRSLIFVLYTFACVLGFWLNLSMPLLVVGISAALGAWDLDHFCWRTRAEPPVMKLEQLERHHLLQLAIVLGTGLVVALLVLLVQVSLGFWMLFFITLAALFSLLRALTLIHQDDV
ncbi:MAG TPA: hypothetical protein VLH85_07120 [Levilinea sp.]|nr:hypothetical protein [Levilinea sp.]